jgi:hypothetical protein
MEGPWAQFAVESFPDGTVALRSKGNEGKPNADGGVHWYLGITPDGEITGRAGNSPSGRWQVVPLTAQEKQFVATFAQGQEAVERPLWCEEADLTAEQKRAFARDGFLHVPGVVPHQLVDDALRVINARLCGESSMEYNDMGHLHLSGGVQGSKEILRLLYASPAFTLAQRLLGRDRCSKPHGGQIALRGPELQDPHPMGGKQWHVDGLEKEHHSAFTILLGVTLSDCPEDFCGNFTVHPGSHTVLSEDMAHLVHNDRPPSTLVKSQFKVRRLHGCG